MNNPFLRRVGVEPPDTRAEERNSFLSVDLADGVAGSGRLECYGGEKFHLKKLSLCTYVYYT